MRTLPTSSKEREIPWTVATKEMVVTEQVARNIVARHREMGTLVGVHAEKLSTGRLALSIKVVEERTPPPAPRRWVKPAAWASGIGVVVALVLGIVWAIVTMVTSIIDSAAAAAPALEKFGWIALGLLFLSLFGGSCTTIVKVTHRH